mmetsp:Transcript_58780/g.126481  ORF Transcript_58780/g.126481 Transcript_58780/m.126481 type:complete len:113 (-) Transcript_58780:524-862(-)
MQEDLTVLHAGEASVSAQVAAVGGAPRAGHEGTGPSLYGQDASLPRGIPTTPGQGWPKDEAPQEEEKEAQEAEAEEEKAPAPQEEEAPQEKAQAAQEEEAALVAQEAAQGRT